ncbi:hypothetical protein MtrunA17_Chr5g0398261 [Medicago truncatula]|uniref:Uncharacterized protein n=1 Tax=Medicago truncatula TaxID=3880 RepID=A0A396HK12_MEDTR|nr:hypothetical protein MtrunA17_Chr5g0398261 [Medicago truncatula]
MLRSFISIKGGMSKRPFTGSKYCHSYCLFSHQSEQHCISNQYEATTLKNGCHGQFLFTTNSLISYLCITKIAIRCSLRITSTCILYI